MRIIRESGTLQQASASSLILGDKGYVGQLGIVTPQRKTRKRSRELLALDEEKNKRHELESERSAIENINQRVKQWHIIGGVYRGEHPYTSFARIDHNDVCVIGGVTLYSPWSPQCENCTCSMMASSMVRSVMRRRRKWSR